MPKVIKLAGYNIFFNMIDFLLLTLFLDELPLSVIVIMIFILPVVINGITDYWFFIDQSDDYSIANYIVPIVSMIGYLMFGWITLATGSWAQLVEKYTTQSGDMYIEIDGNPVKFTALIFMGIVYFGIHYLLVKLIKKGK